MEEISGGGRIGERRYNEGKAWDRKGRKWEGQKEEGGDSS